MYALNDQVVDVLSKVRAKLEAAWGPEAPGQPDNNAAHNADPGTGGATNPTDVNDAMTMYLSSLVDRLIGEYDFDEDAAFDFIFACADEMAEDGDLPEFPEDDAADQDVSVWLGKAGSVGFTGYVLGRARSA